MAEQVRRTKTKYKNIYYNESTKRYDVKYNFKEYDPITQKNRYKAKWKYNLRTISEAKEELAQESELIRLRNERKENQIKNACAMV